MRPPRLCPGPLWLLGLAPTLLSAHALPRERPELVGMSSVRVARLARVLQAHVESGHVAGAIAIVLRRGGLVVLGSGTRPRGGSRRGNTPS